MDSQDIIDLVCRILIKKGNLQYDGKCKIYVKVLLSFFYFYFNNILQYLGFYKVVKKVFKLLVMFQCFFVFIIVFMLLFCVCIYWNYGVYISSNFYDKLVYSNVVNSLVWEYRNMFDFKI